MRNLKNTDEFVLFRTHVTKINIIRLQIVQLDVDNFIDQFNNKNHIDKKVMKYFLFIL